jgi:hypothetical protein
VNVVSANIQLRCKILVASILPEREAIMTKIDREKIVRAVGSARLEGYKGPLKVTKAKKGGASQAETKPKTTAKH